MVEATDRFWAAVQSHAHNHNIAKERLRKLQSAHIMRSLSAKTSFATAATLVDGNVAAAVALIRQHHRDLVVPGACREADRDRIEAEVGSFLRACTANIARLEAGVVADSGPATDSRQINATASAHRHGVCLILSEKLQAVGRAFDQCRSLRFEQQARQNRRRLPSRTANQGSSGWRREGASQAAGHVPDGGTSQSAPQQESAPQQHQQVVDAENAALQQELLALGSGVQQVERSMREVAALNQMFSTQVIHQSHQIETLYTEAVKATANISRGNVHLQKAIQHNAAGRKYVLVLLVLASMLLVFLDWYYAGRLPQR